MSLHHAARASMLGSTPEQFRRLQLSPSRIEAWEDGMRTDGSAGTFEWWYFDAHMDDGSKLVVIFFTKPFSEIGKPLRPYVEVTIDRPDGTSIDRQVALGADAFSAATDHCEVAIGPNRFTGDLHTYRIHVEIEDVVVDVTLTGEVPSWRPHTGHWFYGDEEEHFFAWLPSVPQGAVDAVITVGGDRQELTGTGYHDHNWGNVSMLKLMNHWYWARGKVGDYTVIACHITAEKAYGHNEFPVFMLARGGEIIADDAERVTFSIGDVQDDAETGKPVADVVAYDYAEDDERHFVITFRREKTILRHAFSDELHGVKALVARVVGFDGCYLRFTGDLGLERSVNGEVVESLHDEAIWELMYFGHVPE
jgi:hypothetical protein